MSEFFVRNFHTLKMKYDLVLCQERLHTVSKTFVKKFRSGLIFCIFHILSKHFESFFLPIQSHRTSKGQNPEWQLSSSSTSSRSTKCFKDSCTPSSQKLVVFFLICGFSIASIASLSHWHPEVNFESPVIIPLLLDKLGELSFLSIYQDWMDPIFPFSFSF